MAEGVDGAVGSEGARIDGRLRALGRAVLFALLFLVLFVTGILLVPGAADTALPAGNGLPASTILQFLVALAAALAAAWVLHALVERRAAATPGFPLTRRAPLDLAGGLLAGVAAMAAVVAVFAFVGAYGWAGAGGTVAGWLTVAALGLAAFAIPAAAEEAVFRGYLLRSLGEAGGAVAAVLITSALFAVVHGGNPAVGPVAFANLFLAGVLLAVAVLRTGTLWLATGVHLGWNWVTDVPLDLPVSGIDAFDTPLYDAVPAAPAWLSGGAFGPEGGLVGTAGALAALGLVLWLTRAGAPLAPAATKGSI